MLKEFIDTQKSWSMKTFGPGKRTKGICAHIRKELGEIEAAPWDLEEWVDVIILGIDGAWRSGHGALEIVHGLRAKQAENFVRKWPRPGSEDDPMEHVREVAEKGELKSVDWIVSAWKGSCQFRGTFLDDSGCECRFQQRHRLVRCSEENCPIRVSSKDEPCA